MSDYRRLYQPGGTDFFTVVAAGRRPWMSGKRELDVLRRAYGRIAHECPFETLAAVALPYHLHCIRVLPADDFDFSTRWKKIKRITSNGLGSLGMQVPFWRPRFRDHLIRDADDLRRHMDS